jgi:predicted P-loop ATPase
MTKNISIFSNVTHTKGGKEIPVDLFFERILNGHWQDYVLPIRALTNEAEREAAKKRVPLVTLSGTFTERTDKNIKSHSSFIGIDVDDVEDPEKLKDLIKGDRYLYAAFTSISGKGLCLVFKINGDKHRELFAGLSEYLASKYQIIADAKCINVSRARFISFDPYLYLNDDADKFNQVPKSKPIKQVPQVVYVQSDFEMIINEITTRQIDLTEDYNDWLRVGFALADKFGENGRGYFHLLSQFNSKYDSSFCDRQYSNCLRAGKYGVTIATVYYMAKNAGITTVSEKTKIISKTAYHAKKGRSTKEAAIHTLQTIEGITEDESRDIVDQVFDNNITVSGSDNAIDEIEMWLRQNYTLRYNEVFKKIELNGNILDDRGFNSLFISGRKLFDKELTKDLLFSLVDSDFTGSYNPIIEFFEKNEDRKPTGVIKKFFSCIKTDTGFSDGNFFPDFAEYFGTKWLVSVIASAYGTYSNLMLILTGKQHSGKTRFFRDILPAELKKYFSDCKFENGKDDEILMSSRLILFDDEMSGKTHKEEKRMKHRLDRDVITLRKPFNRFDVDLKRLAVFCATTNEEEVLHDPTGNRRYLPIHVIGLDFDLLNSIDRIDLLIEAYHLYRSGFDWQVTPDDVKLLNDNTKEFESTSIEYDVLTKYFNQVDEGGSFYTMAEIKEYLERRTVLKLTEWQLKREVKRLKWQSRNTKVNGRGGRYFNLKELQPFYVDSSNAATNGN